MTTNSLKALAEFTRVILITAWLFTDTFCVSKPIKVKSKTASDGALRAKLPSTSVIVPLSVPSTRILTPTNGSLFSLDVTLPVILISASCNGLSGGEKAKE